MNLLEQFDDFDARELVSADTVLQLWREDRPAVVALDTESPTWRWYESDADPFAVTLSWGRDRTFYVVTRNEDAVYQKTHYVDDPGNHRIREDAAKMVFEIFNDTPTIVMHNAKYDLHVFKRMFDAHGLELMEREVHDTMIMSPILNEKRHHGLKELSTALGISYDTDGTPADFYRSQIDGWRESQAKVEGREIRYDEVPLRLMVPYAVGDAYLTLALFAEFMHEMEKTSAPQSKPFAERDLPRIYATELDVMWVLFWAEERGMRIDLDFVNTRIAELTPTIEEIRVEMTQQLGWDMNPGSTDDVAKALEQFGIKGDWVNPRTGRVKLPEWVLEGLDHPFAKRVLEYRSATKMLGSYYEHLAQQHRMIGELAIISCNFKQMGARTGRMSITEPALQTIPREKGGVRGAFIARPGHQLIFADFKAQELRVLGHYMAKVGDDSMLRIFEQDDPDPHRETAAAMYRVRPEEVTKQMRADGKTMNFAIVYGAGQQKIADMLGVELDQGKKMLYAFYDRFPGIRKLKSATEQAMRERGYIVTVFGRRHREEEGRFAYKAVNSLVQGTSADQAKSAMVRLHRRFEKDGMRSRVLLQIHDEVVVECPEEELDLARETVRAVMCDWPELLVPMDVDINHATRWSDAK